MGRSIGFDIRWQRDIGDGVTATCDHLGCGKKIDRGLAYVCCGQQPYGGEGCGLYFCEDHHYGINGECARCDVHCEPFDPTPDTPEWLSFKETDASWAEWRKERDALKEGR